MAYSRNEYLKQLNIMRNNYQSNGNALINTMDDSTAVGEELSSFAYMNTPTKFESLQENSYKESRNGWQRTMDTVEELGSNVRKGFLGFLDSVGDFVIGLAGEVGSWFGADTEWAENAIKYDWVSQANEALSFLNPYDFLSGDAFDKDYYQEFGKAMTDVSAAQSREANLHQGSWVSDASESFQRGYQNVTEGIGELLPSVALAIATGGSSVGVQVGVQAGTAFAKSMGQSTESALQDGADFQGAIGYGATKGAVSATITALTVGIGGSVLSNGNGIASKAGSSIGQKVFEKTGSKAAEVFASKATEVLIKAGIDGTSAAAQVAMDPMFKQITYDSQAIEKAYGSQEAVQQTLSRVGNAFTCAAITSSVISSAKEIGSFAVHGKDGYMADYYSKQAAVYENRVSREIKKLSDDISAGKRVDIDARMKLINDYNSKVESFGQKALGYAENIYNAALDKNYQNQKNAKTFEEANNSKLDFGSNKNVMQRLANTMKMKTLSDRAREYINSKGFQQSANNQNEFTSTDGSLKLTYNDDGEATITTPNNPNSPIALIENKSTGDVSLEIISPNQAVAMLSTLTNNNLSSKNLPSTFLYEDKMYELTVQSLKKVITIEENKDNKLFGLNEGETALKYLNNNYTKDEIRHLNNSKSQLITTDQELKKYIYDVFNNYDSVKKLAIIGRITVETTTKLKNDTGKDFSDFSLAYNKSFLKHIEKDHILNTNETLPLSYSDLFKFPYIMENYDTATIGDNGKLILTKWINDQYKMVAEYSMKSKNLVLNSLYKIKKGKNKSLPTAHDSTNPVIARPERSGVSSSFPNNNIPKNNLNVQGNLNNQLLPTKLVKDSANLRHEKVYSLKTTEGMLDNIIINIQDKLPENVSIDSNEIKTNLIRKTFNELNLSKDIDSAVKNIVDSVLGLKISVKKTDIEISGKLNEFVDDKIKSDLEKCINGLISHKGDESYVTKLTSKYLSIIDNLSSKIKDLRTRTEYLIDSIKKINSLKNKIEKTKTMTATGDMVIEDINLISKLIKGIKLSRSMKGISPLSVTHFVENLRDYSPGLFEDTLLGYNSDLKEIANYFEDKFVDGKFPNRELSLEETKYFNKALEYINAMAKELTSEKTKQMIEMVKKGHNQVKFIADNISQKKYGFVKELFDGTISPIQYLSNILGEHNEITKLLSSEYMDARSNETKVVTKFTKLVFESIATDCGIKPTRLMNLLKKKIMYKGHKLALGNLLDIYCHHEANKEFFNNGIEIYSSRTHTRSIIKISDSEWNDFKELIPEKFIKLADITMDRFLGGDGREYLGNAYYNLTGLKLEMPDKYYQLSRGQLNNTGLESLAHNDRGFLTTAGTKAIQHRTKSSAPIRMRTWEENILGYINQIAHYGELTSFIDKYRIMMNKKIDGISIHNLLDQIIPNWTGGIGKDHSKGWNQYLSGIILGKPLSQKESPMFNSLYGNAVTATLYANPSTAMKQLLSDLTLAVRGGLGAWAKSLFRGIYNLSKWKEISNILENEEGYFIRRWHSDEVLKSYTGTSKITKLQKLLKPLGAMIELTDKSVIVGHGWAMAQFIAKQSGAGDYWTDSNNKLAAKILRDLVLTTQSNSEPIYTSMLRSGYLGSIQKQIFGIFGSDNQNKASFASSIKQAKSAEKRAKAYEEALKDENISDEQREFYKEEFKNAKKESTKVRKTTITFTISLIMGGIATALIQEFVKIMKGKKDLGETNPEEFLKDAAIETMIGWIPYVGTFANAVSHNSDISLFTLDNLNELISLGEMLFDAETYSDEAKFRRLLKEFVIKCSSILGIPMKNLYDYILGLTYIIDKDTGLKWKNWTNGYSSSYMKSTYSDAIKKGLTSKAESTLKVWSSMYSIELSDEEIRELVILDQKGCSASPKSILKSYINESGIEVELTKIQQDNFSQYYSKASDDVQEFLKIDNYKHLSDEQKSLTIRRIYNAYYEYSKIKITNGSSSNKLVKLLSASNGQIGLSKILNGVNALSTIKATKSKTRKELVLEKLNSMKNYSKVEKLLIVYLLGYSISDNMKGIIKEHFRKYGASSDYISTLFTPSNV